jgi:hypothetical protein
MVRLHAFGPCHGVSATGAEVSYGHDLWYISVCRTALDERAKGLSALYRILWRSALFDEPQHILTVVG